MNIGVVYPTFGGSGIVATELGHALAEKGHHVHLLCMISRYGWILCIRILLS